MSLIVLAVAALAACGGDSTGEGGSGTRPSREAAPQPNIVVWLVDTLRADRTSAYGYERPTTPTLERLAAQGVLFESFYVHSNWTQPSVTSLMSGRYPINFPKSFRRRIPDQLVMAADWLSKCG